MTTVDAEQIRAGDLVTLRQTFVVTEVTANRIWAGPVAFAKTSQFPDITMTWDLFPVTP